MSSAPGRPHLDESAFRVLAHASHRLRRTIEFEHTNRERGTVHAWIRRPFDLRVETSDGQVSVEHTGSTGSMFCFAFEAQGEGDPDSDRLPSRYADGPENDGASTAPQDPSEGEFAPMAEAARFVARATRDIEVQHDGRWVKGDPLYENYQWSRRAHRKNVGEGGLHEEAYEAAITAEIDPDSAHAPGVLIHRLSAEPRNGRDTWWAEVSPDPDTYEPRCGCCPLLLSEVSDRLEYGDDPTVVSMSDPTFDYTTRFLVALDVETGLCVAVNHLNGSETGDVFNVRVLAVDEQMSDELFASRPLREQTGN